MEARLHSFAVFALYQLSLLAGIVMLPVALVANHIGVRLPLDRPIKRLEAAYEGTESGR